MGKLAPISECVEQLARHYEALNILREVYKRRPAIMVGELLDKLKVFEHPVYREPQRREPRSLKNHPVQPLSRR